ncbi:MAG: Rrf2 family transcriptional regulator [Aquihabitans sp.]
MRLEITRRADLAVRAMGILGQADGRWKSSALAGALDTTAGFVPQVLNPLVKAGWVASDPGPSGGYRLVASLAELSVLDVVEAIDGPTDNGRCVVADQACDGQAPCVLHAAWSRARGELVDALGALTLAQVQVDPSPQPRRKIQLAVIPEVK